MQTLSTVMLVRIASSHKVFSLPSRYLFGLAVVHVGHRSLMLETGVVAGLRFWPGGGTYGTSKSPFCHRGIWMQRAKQKRTTAAK